MTGIPADGGIARRDQLVVLLGDQVIQTITIDKGKLNVGRLPDNDLVLNHPEVSRRHAELRREPQGYVLIDTGSKHGTAVDGVLLLPDQPRLLEDGAEIHINPYVIVYRSSRGNWPLADAESDAGSSISLRLPPKSTPRPVHALPQQLPIAMKPPRPALPADATLPQAPSSYLKFLPIIFQESDFLGRFLTLLEAIWEPLETRQDHINMYLDPRTCPACFLPWLASWFGLEVNPHWPEGRLRSLLTEIIELYRWRGTKYGLARMIELCTGAATEITENPSEPFVFRVLVTPPEGTVIEREFVEDLISAHKPAYAGYILEIVAPSTGAPRLHEDVAVLREP